MTSPRYLILALTVLILALVFNKSQSASSSTGQTFQPAHHPHYERDPQIPGSQESIAEAGTSRIRSYASGIPQSVTKASPAAISALSDLPGSEQKSLWKAFSEARREVRPIPEARAQRPENLGFDFYALHPKQNLTTRFGSDGVQFVSSDRTYTEADAHQFGTFWQAEMRLRSFGGEQIQPGAPAMISGSATSRVEYRHTSAITEWYDNGVIAMEHGYTVAQRPAHLNPGEDVVIEVSLDGLQAVAHTAEDGTKQLIFNEGDRTVLSYSKLLVLDAQGNELPATMKPTDAGFMLAYNDAQAAYPVTVDPLIVNEEAKLNRIDAAAGDLFGLSVAISGDSVVVGARGDDDGGASSGSAYVFTRIGTSWSQQAKLTAGDAAADDDFGQSVSISGDTVVVGAIGDDDGGTESGSAYVFSRSGISWTQQAKLTASDAGASDKFGESVSISGDSVVVGAYWDDDGGTNSGSAYVFARSGTSWSEQAKLTADDAAANDEFGISVGISGDSVVVGAHWDDDAGTRSGSAYVFTRSGTSWSQQAKLTAGDAAVIDLFGSAVAISGNSVVVGAYSDDDGGTNSGSAYVFSRSGASWSQQAKLTAGDAAAGDNFGISVGISGDSVVVGTPNDDDDGLTSGSAYVFSRAGTAWSQQAKLTAVDAAAGDQFGFSVAISGDSIVVGAYRDDDGGSSSGSAYVFTSSGSSWFQQAKLIPGDAAVEDSFGYSVAISGDFIVVGAYNDDDGGASSGSAYVFTRSGTSWSQQAKLTSDDTAAGDSFGYSVAISGNSVVVGAERDDDGGFSSGSAYVFTRTGTVWSQQAKLTASDAAANDRFGFSVAIFGDSVVVGAYLNDDLTFNTGSAYVFTRSGSSWSEQDKLAASDAADNDLFGYSVAISADSVVVGAYQNDDGGTDSGSAYVFARSGLAWSEQAKLTASDAAGGDRFGISVAISGDYVVVGADGDDLAVGSAYVFRRNGTAWSQQAKLTPNLASINDNFGRSVAISGDSVVVGAYGDDNAGSLSGMAYVFTRSGTLWSRQANLTASDAAAFDRFGFSVAISGDSIVVGAHRDDDGGSDSGSVYIYRVALPGERQLLAYDGLGTMLDNTSSAAPFTGQLLGTSGSYTFRLANAGELDLDLQTISLGGANLSEFSLTLPDISSTADLSSGQSTDFTITFSPSGVSSALRNASIIITSNDTDTSVFSFNISGLGLSSAADGDGDGMNDWAEYSLRGFGFDWTVAQPNKVNDYYDLASTAGLYTESQLAAVNVSGSLVSVDETAGTAAFVIGLEESDDMENFRPIVAEASKLSIDGDGKIRYEVETSAETKFIRAGVGK